jgi:hypothetical protein
MPAQRIRSFLPWAGAFVLGVVVATYVARPFTSAPIAYDTAASVLHFDRIVAGHHLDGPLTTTPKPLLTLLFGGLYSLSHDWRALSFANILVFALDLALAAALARRVAGGVAALFVVVGLANSASLMGDTALALGAPWALSLLLVAGLLSTGEPPRYALAGLALAGAALVRTELLVLPVAGLIALGVLVSWPGQGKHARHHRAWLVLIGFAALPVMLVHDWLLTGDPLYWTTIATLYSQATSQVVRDAIGVAEWMLGRYGAQGGLVLLAGIGCVRLFRERRVAILVGLAALGPGIAIVLVALAARGVFVADRYAIPIDVAITFAAAFGATQIVVRGLEGLGPAPPSEWRTALVAVSIAVAAFLMTSPPGFLDSSLLATVRMQRQLSANEARVLPTIRESIATLPDAPLVRAGAHAPFGQYPVLIVPVPIRPRIAVELDLSLSAIGSLGSRDIDLTTLRSEGATLIYHDRLDGSAGHFKKLEIEYPAMIDGRRVEPLLTDFVSGYWLVRVAASGD